MATLNEYITVNHASTHDSPSGQLAPLPEPSTGNMNIEEVLAEINKLALKVGGLKNLAAIIDNLQY